MKHDETKNKKVVTRFAPSPTGFMHVGGVRTALYAWLYARKHGGTFILRIEDTDKEREVEGSIGHIMEALKWLGIKWDEGPDIGGPNAPYLQSERLDSYRKYAQMLIDKGLAYADPYTEEELDVFRKKAEDEKRPFLYRDHRPENTPTWDGTQPLRLKIENPDLTKWHDLVRGDLSAGPEALDDFVLIKSDGYPTYNFAHIIDDLEMGVTHIMRADEFISSTPKFLALYEALSIEQPHIATLPPIMAPDGKKKLGKRDGAKDTLDYRNEGYLPEAMMNFLAFIGWNPGGEQEIYSKDELIKAFEIEKIHVSGGKFNEEKLKWFNKEYIKKMHVDDQFDYIKKFLPEDFKNAPYYEDTTLAKITHIIVDRITHFGEVGEMAKAGELEYFFKDPNVDSEMLVWKKLKDEKDGLEKTKKYLGEAIEILEQINIEDWTEDEIKHCLMEIAGKYGNGEVLWPIRVALSGREKSPDPFSLASILGKEKTIARIKKVI